MPDTKKKKGLLDKTGEAIERVGEKISEAGAPKTGKVISNVGDSIERTHEQTKHSGQNRS